jgi:hypothetical protein
MVIKNINMGTGLKHEEIVERIELVSLNEIEIIKNKKIKTNQKKPKKKKLKSQCPDSYRKLNTFYFEVIEDTPDMDIESRISDFKVIIFLCVCEKVDYLFHHRKRYEIIITNLIKKLNL